MSQWSGISEEILRMIFFNLRKHQRNDHHQNLIECSLTCRGWRQAAQAVLFYKVHFKSDNKRMILAVVKKNPTLGKWLRIANVDYDCSSNLQRILYDTLFPNVEEIGFYKMYAPSSTFPDLLIKEKRFPHLKTLDLPLSPGHVSAYYRCLWYMRDRISKFSLFIVAGAWAINNELYDYYSRKQHYFSALKEIDILCCKGNASYRIVDFLEEFGSHDSISTLIHRISFTKEATTGCYSTTRLDNNNIQPAVNITKLCLLQGGRQELYVPGDDFLNYIAKKFPKLDSLRFESNLEPIEFRTTEGLPEKIGDTIQSPVVIISFLKYLSNIPYCSVKFVISSGDNTAQVIRSLYSSITSGPSSLVSSRHLQIRCNKPLVSNTHYHKKVFLNFQTINLKAQKIRIISNHKDTDSFLEHQLDLIERIGHFFDKVDIVVFTPNDLEPLLNHVVKYCTQINDLTIDVTEDIGDLPFTLEGAPTTNNTVKKLTLSGNMLTSEQLLYVTQTLTGLENLAIHPISNLRDKHKETNSHPLILLPGASFKTLEIMYTSCSCFYYNVNPKSYYIKLVTDSEENDRYCFLKSKSYRRSDEEPFPFLTYIPIANPTEADYNQSIPDQKIITWRIHCRSVENFIVKYFDTVDNEYKKINVPSC